MRRIMTSGLALVAVLAAHGTASATLATCRRVAGAQGSSLYGKASKEFTKCSATTAGGGACITGTRDAKMAVNLSNARATILKGCTDPDAVSLGFGTAGDLAIRVAGAAAGEGRQTADAVFGRDAAPLGSTSLRCAKTVAAQVKKAGAKQIKTLTPCGAACAPLDLSRVDTAWNKASLSVTLNCPAGDINLLLGGNIATYLAGQRANAQRVVNALAPGASPVVSLAIPAPNTILTPPGLPTNVSIEALVANVPHLGYVTSLAIAGQDAAANAGTGHFERTLSVSTPRATLPVVLQARTTFGTVTGTGTLRFNLASVAPGVLITSPSTGTITGGSSVTVSGQVIGNLAQADVLRVNGANTGFNPSTGAFSTTVPIGPSSVNVVSAEVQSLGLGTSDTDTVVVMKGTAWPIGLRVPSANTNRLNNSGFVAVSGIIQNLLGSAFAPSAFIGTSAGGGTIVQFSTGTKSANVFASGVNTVTTNISINNLHIRVNGIPQSVLGIGFHCDVTFDAANLSIAAQANLIGQLQVSMNAVSVVFTGDSASASGNVLCDIGNLITDVKGEFRTQFTNQINTVLPTAINTALAGINVSGGIGASLDVVIDATYQNIVEDAGGVTFLVDSNITATNPVPDAPNITATLLPSGVSPPVISPTIPGTGTPYGLGFCLSDGFVNRAMAAFMRQGRFNQSIANVPATNPPVPITVGLLQALIGGSGYPCSGSCPAAIVLKPTAAAVARAPLGGENASVVLTVPNYRVDLVVQPPALPPQVVMSANVTFEIPLTLGVSAAKIVPSVGTLALLDTKVTSNPFNASELGFVGVVNQFFPGAAASLGGLFGEIPLPSFQGLNIAGVGSGYNQSCTGLYLNLVP